MQQMDGTRSLQVVCDALQTEIGKRATPGALEVLITRLNDLGLVESPVQEGGAPVRARNQERAFRSSNAIPLRHRLRHPDVIEWTWCDGVQPDDNWPGANLLTSCSTSYGLFGGAYGWRDVRRLI
jgi:hypothetical protein